MSLSGIRDLLIIIGIYCYFIAWVYLHTYYDSFGIATESLRLSYTSYLIFSYDVLTSDAFIRLSIWAVVAFICLSVIFLYLLHKFQRPGRIRLRYARTCVILLVMVALFPILFQIAKQTALQNYSDDRTNTGTKHRIEFIFRKNAGLDSNSAKSNYSLNLLNTDAGKNLRLLAESDEYFIVLNQMPYDSEVGSFPEGAVYYIDKKDILVSHIILSSR
ncbi:MAG TPA: hypothetical protein VGZ90_19005 [Puia sp.]|nr:hypothetical protein [Puia sp.]